MTQYKKLAMLHHPDCGGTTEEMQEINAEYDELFAVLKNAKSTADGNYTEDFYDIVDDEHCSIIAE